MTARRPSPEFRPKGYRQRQQAVRRKRRWAVGGVAAVVALLGGVLIAFAFLGGGGGGDSGPDTALPPTTPTPSSTGGVEGGPSPKLEQPAARYAPALNEMPSGYTVLPPETYVLSALAAVSLNQALFDSQQDGEDTLDRWHYVDGYRATYQPAGQLADVVRGAYYATVDTYLFADESGARSAYARFVDSYSKVQASERLPGVKGLANESSAWKYRSDETVGTSDIVEVYHRFLFRRGNLVVAVQTTGGDPFMTIDRARNIAVVVDERALGTRTATVPTPRATSVLPGSTSP